LRFLKFYILKKNKYPIIQESKMKTEIIIGLITLIALSSSRLILPTIRELKQEADKQLLNG